MLIMNKILNHHENTKERKREIIFYFRVFSFPCFRGFIPAFNKSNH